MSEDTRIQAENQKMVPNGFFFEPIIQPFRVWFTNFGWYANQEFETLEDAINYGKGAGFEFSVSQGENILVCWSPIGGLRRYS